MSLSHLLPSLMFPSPSVVLQLTGSRQKRIKRQIVVDDVDAARPYIIEPQAAITILSPRKETFLLVRNGSVLYGVYVPFNIIKGSYAS